MSVCSGCNNEMEFQKRVIFDEGSREFSNVKMRPDECWIYIFKCPVCGFALAKDEDELTAKENNCINHNLQFKRLLSLRG